MGIAGVVEVAKIGLSQTPLNFSILNRLYYVPKYPREGTQGKSHAWGRMLVDLRLIAQSEPCQLSLGPH